MNKILFLVNSIALLSIFILPSQAFSQVIKGDETYIITKISKSELCAGQELLVNTKQVGKFPQPPQITIFIQLSNSEGSFESFTNIGSSFNLLNISCIVPEWLEASNNYKIRMRTSVDLPNHYYIYPQAISIAAAPPTYTISGNTTVCKGSTETYTIDLAKNDLPKWTVKNGVIVDSTSHSIAVKWSIEGIGAMSVQALPNKCGAAEIALLDIKIQHESFCITNVDESSSKHLFITFAPNPVQEVMTIESNFEIEKSYIQNYQGQMMTVANATTSINVQDLQKGLYLLVVEGKNKERIIKKFIKM